MTGRRPERVRQAPASHSCPAGRFGLKHCQPVCADLCKARLILNGACGAELEHPFVQRHLQWHPLFVDAAAGCQPVFSHLLAATSLPTFGPQYIIGVEGNPPARSMSSRTASRKSSPPTSPLSPRSENKHLRGRRPTPESHVSIPAERPHKKQRTGRCDDEVGLMRGFSRLDREFLALNLIDFIGLTDRGGRGAVASDARDRPAWFAGLHRHALIRGA